MTAVPGPTAVTVPPLTRATPEFEVDQVTVLLVALSGLTVALRVDIPPVSRIKLLLDRLIPVTLICDGVGAGVAAGVGAGVAVGFAVGLGVAFGFAVGFGVAFVVGFGVGFGVGLGVAVGFGVGVAVGVGVGVASGIPWTVSILSAAVQSSICRSLAIKVFSSPQSLSARKLVMSFPLISR